MILIPRSKKPYALFIVILVISVNIDGVRARPENGLRISYIRNTYELQHKENGNYLCIVLKHFINNELISKEYIGFSKNNRGDIHFTDNGEYIGKIIPILYGEINNNGYLVPIHNIPNIINYGSTWGEDSRGEYLKIYYSGYGDITAYRYDKYNIQVPVNISVNEISLKMYKDAGECKLFTNVSSVDYDLDDSGMGFLFIPMNETKFRYIRFLNETSGNYEVFDLKGLNEKIKDVGIILDFMDGLFNDINIRWDWTDLYNEGNKTHFEILEINGKKGLLTGSYNYGSKLKNEPIVIDPTFYLSSSANSFTIENEFNGGGYNVTIFNTTNNDHGITDFYNYWEDSFVYSASNGYFQYYIDGQSVDYWSINEDSYATIIEESDTRIIVHVQGINDGYWEWNVTWTFYYGSPIMVCYNSIRSKNQGASGYIRYVSGRTNNFDYNCDNFDNKSTSLDYYSNYENNHGNWGEIFKFDNYDVSFFIDNGANDEGHKQPTSNYGYEFNHTKIFMMGESSGSRSAVGQWAIDWVNELRDNTPTITVSEGTYISRSIYEQCEEINNTDSSGNVTFTWNPYDIQNHSAFRIYNWNNSNYNISRDDVLLNETVDYQAYYDDSTTHLDVILFDSISVLVTIKVYIPAPPSIPLDEDSLSLNTMGALYVELFIMCLSIIGFATRKVWITLIMFGISLMVLITLVLGTAETLLINLGVATLLTSTILTLVGAYMNLGE